MNWLVCTILYCTTNQNRRIFATPIACTLIFFKIVPGGSKKKGEESDKKFCTKKIILRASMVVRRLLWIFTLVCIPMISRSMEASIRKL